MTEAVRVILISDDFPRLVKALPVMATKIVKKTAFDIEAQAKARCTAVDTGAMKSSVFTAISDGTTSYDGHATEAASKRPGVKLFPAPTDFKEGTVSALVGPSVEYAQHVEFGTESQPAQPFLIPAAEANRDVFVRAVAAALRSL